MVENDFLGFSKRIFSRGNDDLHRALETNHFDEFKKLLKDSRVSFLSVDQWGNTVIDKAIIQGKHDFIYELIQDPRVQANKDELSKIFLSLVRIISEQKIEIFDDLLDLLLKNKMLNINHKTQQQEGGVLWEAVYYKNKKVLDKLLAHPNLNPNQTTNAWATPLMLAIQMGNKDAYQQLLKRQDVDLNKRSKNQMSAFILALQNNNQELIHLIMDRPDLNVNLGFGGLTPLMVAQTEETQRKIITDRRFDLQKNLMACIKDSGSADLVRMMLELRGDELKQSKNIFYNSMIQSLCEKNFESLKLLLAKSQEQKQNHATLDIVLFKIILIYQALSSGNLDLITDLFPKIDALGIKREKKENRSAAPTKRFKLH